MLPICTERPAAAFEVFAAAGVDVEEGAPDEVLLGLIAPLGPAEEAEEPDVEVGISLFISQQSLLLARIQYRAQTVLVPRWYCSAAPAACMTGVYSQLLKVNVVTPGPATLLDLTHRPANDGHFGRRERPPILA